jgi:hypothetical protein
MKKVTLICAVLLMGFMAACEAEEEPAPTLFLPVSTEPDATADSSDGVDVSVPSDTVAGDTVAGEDTASGDAPVVASDGATEGDLSSGPDAVDDASEDSGANSEVTEEDVVEEDVFTPSVSEDACKLAGNPGEGTFGDVDDQTDVVVSASTTCQKNLGAGASEGEAWFSCVREIVMETYGSTEDCAQCFVLRADCLKNFCFMNCIMSGSSSGSECATCQLENYCLHPFETCTGLTVF